MDDVETTCSETQQNHLIQAVSDAHKLTDAVASFSGDDESFKTFFGIGWSGGTYGGYFNLIASNLHRAAAVLESGGSPLARLQCAEGCPRNVLARTDPAQTDGVQTISFCPFTFTTGGSGFANLIHVSDRVKGRPTSDLNSLVSWEQTLLHEVMHLDNAGYTTPFDTSQVSSFRAFNRNPNHIGDARGTISGLQPDPGTTDGLTSIYGPKACKLFVQPKIPPSRRPATLAVVNADSYAWFASSKFFSQDWGMLVSRADPDDEADDEGATFSDEVDPDEAIIDPIEACANVDQPLADDCKQINVLSDGNKLDFGSACFTNEYRKWCDVYTYETYQITVGWDTTVQGDAGPSLSNANLASAVAQAGIDQQVCSPFYQDNPRVCAVEEGFPGDICTQSYTICVKAVFQDCRPGVNPDGITAGPNVAQQALNLIATLGNSSSESSNSVTQNASVSARDAMHRVHLRNFEV